MNKKVVFDSKLEGIVKGFDTVADAVKVTIGPRGRNVVLKRGPMPIIANDAGTIAHDITLKDPLENIGADFAKEVIRKTSEDVGGARTACAILTQELIHSGMQLVKNGSNMNEVKEGMWHATEKILQQLDTMAVPITEKSQIIDVATISTESAELGTLIADTLETIGKDGIIAVSDSQTGETTVETVDGLKFDKGYISPYMVTNPEKMESVYEDVPILLTDKKVFNYKDIFPVLEKLNKEGKNSLVIIAEDIEGEALQNFILMKIQGAFNILGIKIPGYGDNKKIILEDLSHLVGASIVNDIVPFSEAQLGFAKKVIATKDNTTIVDGKGDITEWVNVLQNRLDAEDSKMEKEALRERIAKLSNGMAVIRVGAYSETEVKYLKLKIEDGVNETKRAMQEGVVVGGNCAIVHATKSAMLDEDTEDTDFQKGMRIVSASTQKPLEQIIENAYGDMTVIDRIKESSSISGYNALENTYTDDMFALGIIDAVKVVKTALRNAVAQAAMILTISVAVVDDTE